MALRYYETLRLPAAQLAALRFLRLAIPSLRPIVRPHQPGTQAVDHPGDDFHLCRTGTQGRAHWCKACYVQYNEERKAQRAADREAAGLAEAATRTALAELDGRS
jgi:hypothetical protein